MENKIKSVEKGYGENSIFFSISPNCSEQYRVDEIKEEQVEEKKEEEEQNILNLDTNSFANVLQQKDEKKEESNKLDLSRMSSLLNGFNH